MKERKHGLLTNALRKAMKKSRNDDEMLANLAIASKALDDDDLFIVTGGAQYEANESALKDLAGDAGLSAEVQNAIQALMGQGGAVFAHTSNNEQANSSDAGIVNQNTSFQPAVYADVRPGAFDSPATDTQFVDGNNHIETPTANQGNNFQMANGSQASVNTGDGADFFKMEGGDVKGKFDIGKGDDTFELDEEAQEKAEISVDAGDGFDLLRLFGNAIKHKFTYNDGKFHMH